eukprot:SAG31_NODE_468_length_15250_cov_5.304138_3_plen_290_part_00
MVGIKGSGFKNGATADAKLLRPKGLCVVSSGNNDRLFIADSGNHCIRSYSLKNGKIATVCGLAQQPGFSDGDLKKAKFNTPTDIAVRANGSLIVIDRMNRCIRSVWFSSKDSGGLLVKTIVGKAGVKGGKDGKPLDARLTDPRDVFCCRDGSVIFTDGHAIRRLEGGTSEGTVQTVAGHVLEAGFVDGVGSDARFSTPSGLSQLSNGDILVADRGNERLRVLRCKSWDVVTVAGTGQRGHADGVGDICEFSAPGPICSCPAATGGGYLVGELMGHCVRRLYTPDDDHAG